MAQKLRPQAETLSGSPQPNFIGYQVAPVISKRDPTSYDTGYTFGQIWDNKIANNIWVLASVSAGAATWEAVGGATLSLQSLTGDTGTAVPAAHNIKIAGTASEITTTASGSTMTLSIPSAFVAPGSIASTTTIASGTTLTGGTGIIATTGNITATAGNLIATAGSLQLNGVASHVAINASAPTTAAVGFVTLSGAATTTLTSSAITANSIILFSLKTLGTLSASAITYTTTGGSATITPAGSTDTSTYGYLIIN